MARYISLKGYRPLKVTDLSRLQTTGPRRDMEAWNTAAEKGGGSKILEGVYELTAYPTVAQNVIGCASVLAVSEHHCLDLELKHDLKPSKNVGNTRQSEAILFDNLEVYQTASSRLA